MIADITMDSNRKDTFKHMKNANTEPKVKRAKVKKIKTNSTAKSLTTIIVALVFTMLIFTGLIYLNNYISEDVSYKNVVVAKTDIPANLYITEENAGDYFEVKSIDITSLPKDAISTLDNYIDRYMATDISDKEVITDKDFKNISTSNFNNPVEVSMAVDNLGNAICGKLRAGDVINITINLKSNSSVSSEVKIYESVVVTGAYDSACKQIAADDTSSNTTYITFNIEKTQEQELNKALINYSSIRVSRVLE